MFSGSRGLSCPLLPWRPVGPSEGGLGGRLTTFPLRFPAVGPADGGIRTGQARCPSPHAERGRPQDGGEVLRAPGAPRERQTLFSCHIFPPHEKTRNIPQQAVVASEAWRSVVARPRRGRGNLILHFAFCSVTHSARRKTVHHLNSALVGEYPPKNGILYRFCLILRLSLPSRNGCPKIGPNMTPECSLWRRYRLMRYCLGGTRRNPVPGQRRVNQLPRLMAARTRPVKVRPGMGVFREREWIFSLAKVHSSSGARRTSSGGWSYRSS